MSLLRWILIAAFTATRTPIIKTFINRQKRSGLIDFKGELYDEIIQYNLVDNTYQPDNLKIKGLERPPMVTIPEYREKFNISN